MYTLNVNSWTDHVVSVFIQIKWTDPGYFKKSKMAVFHNTLENLKL